MTTSNPKRIIPERKRCNCGKLVLNHHWLCDKCYSQWRKKKNKIFGKKKAGKFNPPKWMKKDLNTLNT